MKILKHTFTTDSINKINSVISSGEMGFGEYVQILEESFQTLSGKLYNISLNSASAAAFLIYSYLKETFGTCRVYAPALTFTSTVWAAKHFGHEIVFVDVNDSLLFDCDDYLKKRNTDKQIILMPTLYGGVSTIKDWNIVGDEIVVVDSAHCPTPTLNGDFVFTSFHSTKPICSPDGGMLSTDISEAAEYFRLYRNFGRVSNRFGYDIVSNGFKFYMNNLSAVIALESVKNYQHNLEIRKKNHILIEERFQGRFLKHDIHSSYYFATLISEDAKKINDEYKLAVHYPLLHKTKYYDSCELKNTETLHTKIVNLPLYDINFCNSRSRG